MAKLTKRQIRADLLEQLEAQGKTATFYLALVDDYLKYIDIKNLLIADIEKEGVRRIIQTGNGFTTEKPNESIKNLSTTTATMLKILHDLGLKDPQRAADTADDYL